MTDRLTQIVQDSFEGLLGTALINKLAPVIAKRLEKKGFIVPTEPKTNYDRIRSMSVDKLAQFIPDWSYSKACKCDEQNFVDCNNECEICVKEWLESEV